MKASRLSKTRFLHICLVILSLSGIVGFSVGFGKWFNKWVFLPAFPNALDSAFLAFSAVYLGSLCVFLLMGGRVE